MTIVYCIFSLADSGGMQRALTVKANYLSAVAGYAVHIVTRDNAMPHFTLSAKIRVHVIEHTYRPELSRLLYTIRPDITISLYGEESRFLYKIKDGSKKILEFHFTRNHLQHLVRGLPNVRLRWLRLQYVRMLQYFDISYAQHYDKLVLLTEADRRLWGNPVNAVAIPNPLSFKSREKSDLDAPRILAAGRLIATKGFDLLIDAYAPIARKHPDWKLTIYGEGQDKDFLLDKISALGLEEQVTIRPPSTDLQRELLRSSIYALSSRYEGFGLVITEAMECGVPSVAFNCECGPGEIIRDGFDGLLVPPQNTELFGAALVSLVESKELRHRLGKNALLSADRFSVEKVMGRWQMLFDSLMNNPVHV